ncbi:A-kinase anchor protein 12 isoform X2 [Microcaecilia unicolor]|uniref:A-kinase anchor protein 12 isoform X2 n=1 Tax=Microcaecilia unicolor TaxID=1415580 RepID=A0A6P7XV37_9AMPH|nr:A-kinase anchor protein 12 isoform X2 [Microcaecilia unicolor]
MMGTITITVEQREPANVTQKEESAGNMEVVPPEETDKGHVENGQKEAEEANEEMSMLEEKVEDLEQTSEPQSNEVGFKKVFKFVGFKFTMKKEKTDKSEPVQLLTVKKDEVEANGTHELEEVKSDMPEEAKPNEDMTDFVDTTDKASQSTDSPTHLLPEKTDEATNEPAEATDAAEQKEPNKSPESPTNPIVNETSSSFKKFFTQGWAGLRKKTSFKKSKEEEQQVAMKNEKEEQEEKKEVADILVEAVEEREVVVEKERPSGEEPLPQEAPESVTKDSRVSLNENQAEEYNIIENMELPTKEKLEQAEEEKLQQDEERKVSPAMMTETSVGTLDRKETEILVSTVEVTEKDQVADYKLAVGSLNFEQSSEVIPKVQEVESSNELPEAKEMSDSVIDCQIQQTDSSPEHTPAHKTVEGISSEADLLSSQEKIKLQGSPLKKLFTGSGLKRLSGKKQKGKKEEDSKVEEAAEHLHSSSEPSESQVADKGDSSPSSPEELAEVSSVEKALVDEAQIAETEGEGTTSDGERKKDGITTWASFKKLVTPKKRVKRPSESDKEDEPEKPKSATMSSTESAASVENQEENKISGEEQKPDKSTEETKRKVDSSVSWEALICVGASKKRGKKYSESDEDEAQKPLEESQKIDDEVIRSKEVEAPPTSGQDINQAQGSSSPEQAGSPSEGEGVSTWESFKRLVTPRKKSKTKMEDKSEESAAALNTEHSTSDGEPGKEESWVSFKKLIPGRKKKKSDGKQEYTSAEKVVEEAAGAEAAEEDSDVPAVVPLSEYEAAEQEKTEALQAIDAANIKREIAAQDVNNEEPSEGLMHAVTVTLVEGARAVTSIEERSPSWISATVTESIEQANECEEIQQSRHPTETKIIVEETIVTKTIPQTTKEISEDLLTSEMEITQEAVTALEEAAEISCAEETTEMVSAVSQLSESPVTTEETTPVQEEEESQKSLEDLKKETQEILQEVAEKVRLSEEACMETEVKDERSEEVNIVQSSVFIEGFEQKEAKTAETGKVECSSRSTEGIKEVEESISEGESKMIFETYCLTEKCVPEFGNYEVNHEGTILCEKQNDLHEETIKHQSAEEREKILKVEKKQDVKENIFYSTTTVTSTVELQPEVKMDIETVKQKQKTSAQHDRPTVNDVAQSEITDEGRLEMGSKSASVVCEAKSECTKDLSELAVSLSSLKSKPIEEAQGKASVKTETIQEQVSLVSAMEDGITEKFQEETCHQGKRTEQLEPLVQAAKLMTENSGTEEVIKQESMEPVKSLQELKLAQKSAVMREPEEIKESECEETSAVLQCAHTIKEEKAEEELYHVPEDQTKVFDVQQEAGSVTVLKEQVIRNCEINEDLCDCEISEFKGVACSVPVEEVTDGLEDANVTEIPKVERKEARRASIPVTAAAVEEQVVAETAALIQTYMETVKTVDVDEDFTVLQADDQAAESKKPAIESMSQTAATIVDAAIEAATIGLSDVGLGSSTLAQKHEESAEKDAELQEERKQSQVEVEMQKNESTFTVIQKIVQTTVKVEEKTEETIHTEISSVPLDVKTTVAQVPEFQETLQMDELAVVKCTEKTLASEEEDVHQSNAINYIVAEKVSEEQNSVEHTKDEDISEESGVTSQEQKLIPQAQVGEHVHEDIKQLTKDASDVPKREQEEPSQQEAKPKLVSECKGETQTEKVTSENLADRRHVVDTGISKEKSREFQDLVEQNLKVKDVDQFAETQEQLSQQVEERKQMLSQTEAKMDVLHEVHSQEDESLERTKEQSQSTES